MTEQEIRPTTVLVVEDNPITRKMLRVALQADNHRVLEAADGAAALQLMESFRPDLVLQDLNLPDMDGTDLVGRLRSLENGRAIPILALSGFLAGLEEAKRTGAGFTDYLYKPVEPIRMAELIRIHLNVASDEAVSGMGKRVLVVDDDPLQLKLSQRLLELSGYKVETAHGGAEALERARLSPPDAILSDVLMPGMDGFRFCEAARRTKGLADIPFILYSSAYTEVEDAVLARKFGANSLFTRDPDLREVLQALETALAGVDEPVNLSAELSDREHADREHADRLLWQVNVLLESKTRLSRLLSVRDTQLSLLAAVPEMSPESSTPESMLAELGERFADTLGLARIATFLEVDGIPVLKWSLGFSAAELTHIAAEFIQRGSSIHCDLVPMFLPAAVLLGGEQDEADRLLVVSLRSGSTCLGLIVLDCLLQHGDTDQDENCLAFAGALGGQLGQTLQVAMALRKGADEEARLNHLLGVSPTVTYCMDGEFNLTWISPNISRLLGYDAQDLCYKRWIEHVHPEDRSNLEKERQLPEEGVDQRSEYRFRLADGTHQWVSDERRLVFDEAGDLIEVVGTLSDIRDRKAAEQRQHETEERYRTLFDQSPQAMWVIEPASHRFIEVNDAAVKQYGYSRQELLSMRASDLVDPEFRSLMSARIASGILGRVGTSRHVQKGGARIDVDIHVGAIQLASGPAFLVVADDITKRRKLEEELRQSQKMDSVGRLAGGVAHDFNNMLAVINGYCDLLLLQQRDDPQLNSHLHAIRDAGQRAGTLTQQLLAFSRKQIIQPRVLDLNEVIAGTETMLRRLIGEDIDLASHLNPETGSVRADPSQIDQVLVNLAVNARDAMPTGGRLTIETSNVEVDESGGRLYDLKPGPYVLLAVSDEGCGMDAATCSQLFEPFFTTKEVGRGTGLGLATVHGIIRQSGGHISVYSEPGHGTAFKIYLPRLDAGEALSQAPGDQIPARGTETVLLVEDEEMVRRLAAEVLRTSGYTVVEAGNAEEALQISAARRGTIDLVLTDVVMPRMSGRELRDRLAEVEPGIAVVFMSGYTDDAVVRHGLLEKEVAFLHKPFTPAELTRKVRQSLELRASRGTRS